MELEGVGAFTPAVLKRVREQMDLSLEDVLSIIDRANKKMDKVKRKFIIGQEREDIG